MKKIGLLCWAILLAFASRAQEVIPLYSGTIPDAKPIKNRENTFLGADGKPRIRKVSEPTLSIFLPPPAIANGKAVIICPGGGYAHLSIAGEGYEVAQELNQWGVAAFVLKYRLPDDSVMRHKETGPLQDAQRAIQLIRTNAKKWHINPNKVGIMGFSAGAHVAATLGTHFEKALIPNKAKINLRPDFMVLLYPVISLSDSLSRSSRILLGDNPTTDQITLYSNEFQVIKNTPPAFLVHARDDKAVDVKNSINFYQALQNKQVPAEMHLYEKGGHGFGLNNKMSPDKWTDWLRIWLDKI